MRVTGLPALESMRRKAKQFHDGGGEPLTLADAHQVWLYQSATVPYLMLPSYKYLPYYSKLTWNESTSEFIFPRIRVQDAQLFWEGMNGNFEGFRKNLPPRPDNKHSPALVSLDTWCAAYLSFHAVMRQKVPGTTGEDSEWEVVCTCPGFWTDGVCWHRAHYDTYIKPPEEINKEGEAIKEEDDSRIHGPVNHDKLSKRLTEAQNEAAASRIALPANSKYTRNGVWVFELAKSGRSACKGCEGFIPNGQARLRWSPYTIGTEKGSWHLACGVAISKIDPMVGWFTQITPQVVGTFNGASVVDAEVLNALAPESLGCIRHALRV